MNGKGSWPSRNNFGDKFRNNFDNIKWGNMDNIKNIFSKELITYSKDHYISFVELATLISMLAHQFDEQSILNELKKELYKKAKRRNNKKFP